MISPQYHSGLLLHCAKKTPCFTMRSQLHGQSPSTNFSSGRAFGMFLRAPCISRKQPRSFKYVQYTQHSPAVLCQLLFEIFAVTPDWISSVVFISARALIAPCCSSSAKAGALVRHACMFLAGIWHRCLYIRPDAMTATMARLQKVASAHQIELNCAVPGQVLHFSYVLCPVTTLPFSSLAFVLLEAVWAFEARPLPK